MSTFQSMVHGINDLKYSRNIHLSAHNSSNDAFAVFDRKVQNMTYVSNLRGVATVGSEL